jgi:hypothetical protein
MSPNAELETTLSMIASRQIQEGATHAQSVRFIGSVFERNSCSVAAEGLSKATELSGSALKKTKGGEEKIKRGLRDFMNRKGKSRGGGLHRRENDRLCFYGISGKPVKANVFACIV